MRGRDDYFARINDGKGKKIRKRDTQETSKFTPAFTPAFSLVVVSPSGHQDK